MRRLGLTVVAASLTNVAIFYAVLNADNLTARFGFALTLAALVAEGALLIYVLRRPELRASSWSARRAASPRIVETPPVPSAAPYTPPAASQMRRGQRRPIESILPDESVKIV